MNIGNSVRPFDGFRLRKYYYIVEIAGIFIPLVVAILILLYPRIFLWIYPQDLTVVALLAIFFLHSIFFALHEIFKSKIFFNIARYVYLAMFMFFIGVTGGLASPFIFLLMFPLIVSAVYLDERITKRIGYVTSIFLAGLIFAYPEAWHDPSAIVRHVILTGLFAFIAYLMHKIVIETLRQKYEKEETDRRLAEVVELERLKTDFLGVAQHQLRTPLSGLKWALETLRGEGGMSSQNKQLVEDGIVRANDAISIVNEMLTTAEKDKSSLTLSYIRVDLSRLIRSIVSELSYVAMAKSVSVELVLPEKLEIEADFKKLKASLINIVDNAFKYSPKGKVKILLEKRVEKKGERVAIVVSDNGIGIAPADLPYVFDRLHRGRNAIAMEPNESGIGLYTSKKIIELHGGFIKLESMIGKGTTATVLLPVTRGK